MNIPRIIPTHGWWEPRCIVMECGALRLIRHEFQCGRSYELTVDGEKVLLESCLETVYDRMISLYEIPANQPLRVSIPKWLRWLVAE